MKYKRRQNHTLILTDKERDLLSQTLHRYLNGVGTYDSDQSKSWLYELLETIKNPD